MPLFGRPIESITEQVLQRLIDDKVPEGRSIDYKRDLNLQTDDQKRKFLEHVTAFANTAGGHLIYGIDANGAIPTELVGLALDQKAQDSLGLSIVSQLRTSVRPSLTSVEPWFVALANGKVVLVLRIRQSWASPHMVADSSKFYGRGPGGKFQLDVQDLRAAFAASEDIGRRMGAWRTERIGKILANEAPWTMPSVSRLIVHLIPQLSFAALRTTVMGSHVPMLPLLGTYDYPPRPNFDGWITQSTNGRSLTQLFPISGSASPRPKPNRSA